MLTHYERLLRVYLQVLVEVTLLREPAVALIHGAGVRLLVGVNAEMIEDVVPLLEHSPAVPIEAYKCLRPAARSHVQIFHENVLIRGGRFYILVKSSVIYILSVLNYELRFLVHLYELSDICFWQKRFLW